MTKLRKVTWLFAGVTGLAAFLVWKFWPRRKTTEIRFDVPSSSTNQDFIITGSGSAGANDADSAALDSRTADALTSDLG